MVRTTMSINNTANLEHVHDNAVFSTMKIVCTFALAAVLVMITRLILTTRIWS